MSAAARNNWFHRLATADVSRPYAWLFVVVLCALYVFAIYHLPLTINAQAGHDDALFLALGNMLAEGYWLGPYNQYTLMKGPGYPAFLALSHVVGVPVSISQAVFHCVAVTLFVVVAHRYIRSSLVSAVLFVLLLWQPVIFTSIALRIQREQIYSDQLLIVFAAVAAIVFDPGSLRRRLAYAIVGGAVLGWFWLTREEGIWIVPAMVVMVGLAFVDAYRNDALGRLVVVLLVFAGVAGAAQVGFRTMNWWAYGTFVGVDFKEENFQRALKALYSVRSGGTKPRVAVTAEARRRLAEVSPSYEALAGTIDDSWVNRATCAYQPESCGEIGAAWFMWGVREAVAEIGAYESPARAAAFYGQLADEIEAACADGRLECASQRVATMPPWTWSQLLDGVARDYRRAFDLLLMTRPLLQFNVSNGSKKAVARALRFLNHPVYTPTVAERRPPTSVYTIEGTYYESGSNWFDVDVRGAKGKPVAAKLKRRPSPDLERQDPAASHQRFRLRTKCNVACILTVGTAGGLTGSVPLGQVRVSAIDIGDARISVERVDIKRGGDDRFEAGIGAGVAAHIRDFAIGGYRFVLLPVLGLGILSFVVCTLFFFRRAYRNVCYGLALSAWILVLARVTLIIAIHRTAFNAINPAYLSPAYFMMVCAAVFSCAAWLQLAAAKRGSAETPRPEIPQAT